MKQLPNDNFPVQTLAEFREHVLAFPVFENEEGEWQLDTSAQDFRERIELMKQRVENLFSHEDDGTKAEELPTPERVSEGCQSALGQALDYFRRAPDGTHFSIMLPCRDEAGAVDWQWVLVYADHYFKSYGSSLQSASTTQAAQSILRVMAAKGDPVEMLRQEVAKQKGLDVVPYENEVDLDDRSKV